MCCEHLHSPYYTDTTAQSWGWLLGTATTKPPLLPKGVQAQLLLSSSQEMTAWKGWDIAPTKIHVQLHLQHTETPNRELGSLGLNTSMVLMHLTLISNRHLTGALPTVKKLPDKAGPQIPPLSWAARGRIRKRRMKHEVYPHNSLNLISTFFQAAERGDN